MKKKEYDIPRSHPRYESLMLRERLAKGIAEGITAPEGMIAHGRGEAFDYLLGENTTEPAKAASSAAAAAILLAKHPVISVNGNVAALAAEDIIALGKAIPARLEVNIFHYTQERFHRILGKLREHGAVDVLGEDREQLIPGLDSARGMCTRDGIFSADVVLVPLEDGDRAEGLRSMGKYVITIDLNPLSRTARCSNITIVDNLVRALPVLLKNIIELRKYEHGELEKIKNAFDNNDNLKAMLKLINERLTDLKIQSGM